LISLVHSILNGGKCIVVEGIPDDKLYVTVRKAMAVLNFKPVSQP